MRIVSDAVCCQLLVRLVLIRCCRLTSGGRHCVCVRQLGLGEVVSLETHGTVAICFDFCSCTFTHRCLTARRLRSVWQ